MPEAVEVTRKQFITIKQSLQNGRHIVPSGLIGKKKKGDRVRFKHRFDPDMVIDAIVAQRLLGFHVLMPPTQED